jgi:hypothetical protein
LVERPDGTRFLEARRSELNGDDVLVSCGAVRVMEGQLPYRDFVTLQPPLCFYSAAAAFKLLGTPGR